MNISVEIDIARPKKDVWKAITDIGNCKDMISGIIDIEVLEKPADGLVGLKWREKTSNVW